MRNNKYALTKAIVMVLLFGAFFYMKSNGSLNNIIQGFGSKAKPVATVSDGDLSLITEPGHGSEPFQKMVTKANDSVDVVMYQLNDQGFQSDLVNASKSGVKVRVLLNNSYYSQKNFTKNNDAIEYLQDNNIDVKPTPEYFALTHQKTIITDNKQAAIMTMNLTSQYYRSGREFIIIDKNPKDIKAIIKTFNADWNGKEINPSRGNGGLVWSPGSRPELLSLINGAKKSLKIENEEMSDDQITEALVAAAQRGVKVQITMTEDEKWSDEFDQLTAAGASVHTYSENAPLYIHAKAIVMDGKKAFIGSENFSTASLSKNRELGITFKSPEIIKSLTKTINSDYNGAKAWQ